MKALTLLVVFIALFSSCEKAGTGGKATVVVQGIFQNTGTPGAVVYVKFNQTEYSPTWTSGDLIDTMDNFAEVEFPDLKRGDYYFYSIYTYVNDSGYVDTVKAGQYFKIETKKSAYHVTLDFSAANPF